MRSIKIVLDYDMCDKIVCQSLDQLIVDMNTAKYDYSKGVPVGVFDDNKKADLKEINKMLKAAKRVKKWFEVA